jgi:hypothetical protein
VHWLPTEFAQAADVMSAKLSAEYEVEVELIRAVPDTPAEAAALLRYVVQFWETQEGLEGINQLTTSESLLTIMSNAATVLEGVTVPCTMS